MLTSLRRILFIKSLRHFAAVAALLLCFAASDSQAADIGGNTPALGVVFTDVLPAEVLVAGVSGVGCGIAGNAVTCQLGDMSVGSQNLVTISVVAPPTSGTPISNTGVTVGGDGRDIQPANNSVTINVTTR